MKIRTLLIAIIFMFACSENVQEVQDSEIKSNLIQPFKNIAKEAFGGDFFIENRYPGVAVFDFDRDEDLDLYFTSSGVSSLLEETRGGSNKFFENLGNNKFQDITEKANLSLLESNSTAPAACDFNNDGSQDMLLAYRVDDPRDNAGLIPQIQTGNEALGQVFGSDLVEIRPQGMAEIRFGGGFS